METYPQASPLTLLHLRMALSVEEERLRAHVDPLRRLVRKRNLRISDVLLNLKQIEAIKKVGAAGPIGRLAE